MASDTQAPGDASADINQHISTEPEAAGPSTTTMTEPTIGANPPADTPAEGFTLVELPQKRHHEAMLTAHHPYVEPPHYTWDGSPDVPHLCHSTIFAEHGAKVLRSEGYDILTTDLTTNQSESGGEGCTDGEETHKENRLLTCKEAKALEREIPWRHIMTMSKPRRRNVAGSDGALLKKLHLSEPSRSWTIPS